MNDNDGLIGEDAWAVWPNMNLTSRKDHEDGETILNLAYMVSKDDILRRHMSLAVPTDRVPHSEFPPGVVIAMELVPVATRVAG